MLGKVKTGALWRDLPVRFGPWKTVYSRFHLWSNDDLFHKIFESLASDADFQEVSIDSPSCKVHPHATEA
ncbi:transposase [Paenibacillus tundrae]|uniref:transposase n=1 Tax=Paenibacillus tundrae TaxID=528187 RepID=UPI0039B47E28